MSKHQANSILRNFAAQVKKPWVDSPCWYSAVAKYPPATQYLNRITPLYSTKVRKSKNANKEMYHPQSIHWPEDRLRKKFYQDHPWELARPQIITENDGNDHLYCDWSQLDQPRKALTGENVVQRTMWLTQNKKMDVQSAYDQARHEFYNLRAKQEIQQRIAHDQSQALGAVFTKSDLELGYELDQAVLNDWFEKASQRSEVFRSKNTDPVIDVSSNSTDTESKP
ncbi:ribosomal protein subunit Rsm25 [Schizosaccharomyces cryophilus OY26]|uniref:37S ribosomal protein S25, mitochondrial n=1 Tax=Schizosaccharomyces cryophilus (strain OY26 / ATCC MYA-4695 / CBS 11777 / NBRC 106824 / NRRL Y48691) TaxID=653667 RepID=S9XG47_SCHCR|nr:ribosomal protein subunit Rsm25 [Schizosaccharomyces cryophilus OY26]EPY52631.1 ribosomal protein subunit Rsm25 [Schizosaccharomyces cryophilus OY26]